MMKRGVFVGILLIMLAITVTAEPNADYTLEPTTLYESNDIWFNLSVNNYLKDEIITGLEIELAPFSVTDYDDYLGWQENISNAVLTYSEGSIADNIILALFRFEIKAPLVNEDEEKEVTIIANDDQKVTKTILVLNDDTPPLLSDARPQDGDYFRQGDNNISVHITAIDNETNIYNVYFNWWDCSDDVNETVVNDDLMVCSDGYCSLTEDFSEFIEGDALCFQFIAKNRALEQSTLSGEVGFDGTPPNVALIAPDEGEYANGDTEFSFLASDNLAPTLDCYIEIDNVIAEETSADNNQTESITIDVANMTEGTREWQVTCFDMVRLSDSSEKRSFILDRTPPTITLNAPENGSLIGSAAVIDIEVEDNYEIDDVLYSKSLDISEWDEGPNDLTVTAVDKAGNIAEKTFSFILDKTAPTIDLISPEDNSTMDVHAEFVFDIDDNYDDIIECELYINNELNQVVNVSVPDTAIVSMIMEISAYNWHVSCIDDAENEAVSSIYTVDVQDLSGPDIAMDNIEYVARTEPYEFTVNISDISGVETAYALFDAETVELEKDGDIYTGTIETDNSFTLGIYTLTIMAVDTLGHNSTYEEEFELIQGYTIDLNLDPNKAKPNKQVRAFGTIELDDEGEAPEEMAVLITPSTTINVTITNKSFEYFFNSPEDEGNYDITIEVTSSEGFVHSDTENLNVEAPAGSQGMTYTKSSSSGNGHVYCPDGMCNFRETCDTCPEDCGTCPEEPEEEPEEEEEEEESEEEIIVQEEPEEPDQGRSPSGIGEASGWFNIKDILFSWIGLLLIAAIIITTAYIGFGKDQPKKKSMDWDSYFKKRR